MVSKAKKVAGKVLKGALKGAVTGAAEAGSKATGISKANKSKRGKRSSEGKKR
jgi:hypothetical protein